MHQARVCPVCKQDFINTNPLNINRANLTDRPECGRAQRVTRQRERRRRKRMARLRLQHKHQAQLMFKSSRRSSRTKNPPQSTSRAARMTPGSGRLTGRRGKDSARKTTARA